MKILYHHRTQAEDGQAVHIRSLIRALRALGHEVREEALVTRSDSAEPEPPRKADEREAFPLMNLVPGFLREIAEYGYSIPAGRKLTRAQEEFGADFIYERYAFGNVAGIRTSAKLGVPIVLEVNSPMVYELTRTRGLSFPRHARKVEGEIFRGATRVSVVSRVLGNMVEEYGVPSERIVVIPNGVHLAEFHDPDPVAARANLGLAEVDGPVLGFVGYFRDWHGLDKVVEALDSEALRKTHLVLVGYGPAEASLRSAAQRCGVTDRLHLAGPRKHSEIPGILPAFDIGLVPAINAYASPLKLQEYMAAGLATIAPDQPNLREVLTHGKNGLLFEPGNSAALGEAIMELVADEGQRQRLGAAARQHIVDADLTWDGAARRVIEVVEAL